MVATNVFHERFIIQYVRLQNKQNLTWGWFSRTTSVGRHTRGSAESEIARDERGTSPPRIRATEWFRVADSVCCFDTCASCFLTLITLTKAFKFQVSKPSQKTVIDHFSSCEKMTRKPRGTRVRSRTHTGQINYSESCLVTRDNYQWDQDTWHWHCRPSECSILNHEACCSPGTT